MTTFSPRRWNTSARRPSSLSIAKPWNRCARYSPPEHARAMKAIAEHTVATAEGDGRFPNVAAGTYWVWGTQQEFVSTGATGTITGSTVTLTPSGYQKAVIWNLKVSLEPGHRRADSRQCGLCRQVRVRRLFVYLGIDLTICCGR